MKKLRIVIASDSYKESLSAKEVVGIISDVFSSTIKNVDIDKVPMADGGEGTAETLTEATNGTFVEKIVRDPLGRDILAKYGITDDTKTAIIEMASCCGLALLKPEERNPSITTTYGLGQLIKDALDRGIKSFIVGIGGSATNDAGAGMLQALGFGLKDIDGNEIGFGGYELNKIKYIDLTDVDQRLKDVNFMIACDVNNPLVGENGASFTYGPQKGADPEMVKRLDRNLQHFAEIIKKTNGVDPSNIPGAGAAGGIGAAFISFFNAKLMQGFDIVSQFYNLEDKIKNADIIITGEGKTDHQTKFGKVVLGVARLAQKYNKPVICLSGSYTKEATDLYELGITSLFSCIHKPDKLEDLLKSAKENLRLTAINLARLINIFYKRSP